MDFAAASLGWWIRQSQNLDTSGYLWWFPSCRVSLRCPVPRVPWPQRRKFQIFGAEKTQTIATNNKFGKSWSWNHKPKAFGPGTNVAYNQQNLGRCQETSARTIWSASMKRIPGRSRRALLLPLRFLPLLNSGGHWMSLTYWVPRKMKGKEFWGINWHLRHTVIPAMLLWSMNIYDLLWISMDIDGSWWILTWKAPRLTSPDITGHHLSVAQLRFTSPGKKTSRKRILKPCFDSPGQCV